MSVLSHPIDDPHGSTGADALMYQKISFCAPLVKRPCSTYLCASLKHSLPGVVICNSYVSFKSKNTSMPVNGTGLTQKKQPEE